MNLIISKINIGVSKSELNHHTKKFKVYHVCSNVLGVLLQSGYCSSVFCTNKLLLQNNTCFEHFNIFKDRQPSIVCTNDQKQGLASVPEHCHSRYFLERMCRSLWLNRSPKLPKIGPAKILCRKNKITKTRSIDRDSQFKNSRHHYKFLRWLSRPTTTFLTCWLREFWNKESNMIKHYRFKTQW